MSKGATTQTAEVPEYLQDLYTEASRRGLEAAEIPFQPYTGEMVAGLTPDQQRVFERTRGIFDESMSLDPRAGISNLIAQGSPNIQAASLLDNFSNYQSNLEEAAIDPFLADIDRRRDILTSQAQDRAIRAGAFGGSRSGIIESEATRPLDEATASTIAGLRLKGFQEAAKLADADAARRQQVNLLQPQLDLKQMGFQADLLGNQIGDQYRSLGLLSGIGGQQQALEQARLQAQRGEFERELGFPAYQLGLLNTAAGGISPAVIGQRQQKETGLGDILGTGAGLAAAYFSGGLVQPPKKT